MLMKLNISINDVQGHVLVMRVQRFSGTHASLWRSHVKLHKSCT